MDRKERPLAVAIVAGNYKRAAELVKEEQKSVVKATLEELFFFQNLHRYASGLPLIEALAEKGLVELDLYAYDSIDSSVLAQIIDSFDHATPEDREGLKSILQKTQNLDETVQGKNLMTYAIEQNVHPEILKVLTEAGCDIRFLNDQGENYIHKMASRCSHTHRNEKQSHAEACLEFIISRGVDINASDKRGLPPLLKAMEVSNRQNSEILELLLKHGADIHVESSEGKTALELAIEKYDRDGYRILQEHGAALNLEIMDEKQQSAVYRFLSAGPYDLSEADRELFQLFLEAGFDPYQINMSLYHAEETPLDLILRKAPAYLELLLDYANLDPNLPDQEGNTPLHKACAFSVNFEESKGKDVYQKVKLLIKAGADLSLQNNEGQTARDLASQDEKKYMTVQYLLKREKETHNPHWDKIK